MKIHTLGTSHGDSTFCRFNSSTLYETEEGGLYLFDCGAPAEALIRRKGFATRDLKALFVTHMHDDHAGGLTGLLKNRAKYPPAEERPLPVFLPEETAIAPLKAWLYAVHEERAADTPEFHAVKDGEIYSDDHLTVTAIRTRHLRTKGRTEGDPCSFAYLLYFKKEDKTVLHTGDLSGDFSDFPEISAQRDFDVCLCEATHYHPESALPLLEKSRFGRLIFIHIGNAWHDTTPISPAGRNGEAQLLELCRGLPYPVAIAHDGEEFVV